MFDFKVGQKVCGNYFVFNETKSDYDPIPYEGVINHSFEDGSYNVKMNNEQEVLIELYFDDTMKLL